MEKQVKDIPVKIKHVEQVEYTYTCEECGESITQWVWPGPRPVACDRCKADRKRRQMSERVKRFRSARKAKETAM